MPSLGTWSIRLGHTEADYNNTEPYIQNRVGTKSPSNAQNPAVQKSQNHGRRLRLRPLDTPFRKRIAFFVHGSRYAFRSNAKGAVAQKMYIAILRFELRHKPRWFDAACGIDANGLQPSPLPTIRIAPPSEIKPHKTTATPQRRRRIYGGGDKATRVHAASDTTLS